MSDEEEKDNLFESAKKRNKPPIFENEDHGITAWVDEDKNGNNYINLRLPLGLGTVPLFVNDSGYEDIQQSFNKLIEHINQA